MLWFMATFFLCALWLRCAFGRRALACDLAEAHTLARWRAPQQE